MQNQRKCGVCKQVGHTVTDCTNELAGSEVAVMMCQPLDAAIATARRMHSRYVSFALCHGFGVSTSGGRNKLIRCILQKFGVAVYVPPVAVHVHVPIHVPVAHKVMMKTLQTVITCRNERSKKTDAPITCGICFDDFKSSAIAKTGCGHDFCASCISEWAKQRGIKSFIRCPCCREEIDDISVGNKTELKKITSGLAPKLTA
jgi:hypothetical protein